MAITRTSRKRSTPLPWSRHRWYLLPVLSGWLLSRSCPPATWTPTIWVALVPLCLFLYRCQRPHQAFLGGWCAGLVFFLIGMLPLVGISWWGWTATGDVLKPPGPWHLMLFRLWYPLGSAWAAVWWGLWGAGVVWLTRASPLRAWVAAALWIVLCEALRSLTALGYTWGYLGYALVAYEQLRQVAAYTGVLGLSALVVLVNASIAHLLWRGRAATCAELLLAVSVALTVVGSWMLGVSYYRHRETLRPRLPFVAIQGGQHLFTKEELLSSTSWNYAPLIDQVLARGAKLVIVPESVWAATLDLDDTHVPDEMFRHVRVEEVRSFLAPWLGSTEATLVLGSQVAERGRMHVTILAWDRRGIIGRYNKRDLTPFAEKSAGLLSVLGPKRRLPFEAGHDGQPFTVFGVRMGGLICGEIEFPLLARESVRDGAQVLVNVGNDGIFNDPAVAKFHQVTAQFRAIETHRAMIRAGKIGVSSIIDAHGQPIATAPLYVPAVLEGAFTPFDDQTPYVRWGEWFLRFTTVWLIGWLAWRLAQRRIGS